MCFALFAATHVQTASGKAAHKLEAETEDFHRKLQEQVADLASQPQAGWTPHEPLQLADDPFVLL